MTFPFRLPPSAFLCLALACVAAPLRADDAVRAPVAGDCAVYREGGEGFVLTTPIYWVRGTIVEVYRQHRRMDLCPVLAHKPENYTRQDWIALTDAYPCVDDPAQVRDIDAIRIRLRVDAWETPWTNPHGHNGRLYRGRFLQTELRSGVEIDLDGHLLERCEARQ